MCGRFAIDDRVNDRISEFVRDTGRDFREWDPFTSWNVKPTQQIPVLLETLSEDGEVQRRSAAARWSLVPPWAPDVKQRFPTFNARSEGLAEKRTWRAPLKSSRALIPAAGYYEWHTAEDGTKTPHWIHLDQPLNFAGLYSWWKPKGTRPPTGSSPRPSSRGPPPGPSPSSMIELR
jgi:putative SOS response-associated peptidase YedK